MRNTPGITEVFLDHVRQGYEIEDEELRKKVATIIENRGEHSTEENQVNRMVKRAKLKGDTEKLEDILYNGFLELQGGEAKIAKLSIPPFISNEN